VESVEGQRCLALYAFLGVFII